MNKPPVSALPGSLQQSLSLIERARAFAQVAHADQRYGEYPYVFHLDQVVGLLQDYGEQAQIIGYLHDVVEDTGVEIDGVAAEFGGFVAECVALLTDAPGATRKARKALTYARLAKVGGPAQLALIVKAADRLANVRMCVKEQNLKLLNVYRQEHPTFYLSAYRPGLCDHFWAELEKLLTAQ